jgi:hypothetical protein
MANLNSESCHSLIGLLTPEYLGFLRLQVVPRFTGTCISPVRPHRPDAIRHPVIATRIFNFQWHLTLLLFYFSALVFCCLLKISNLVPRACDPREGTWGSGIIRCRKPGILAKTELRIPYQRPIRFLPETDWLLPTAMLIFPASFPGSALAIYNFFTIYWSCARHTGYLQKWRVIRLWWVVDINWS